MNLWNEMQIRLVFGGLCALLILATVAGQLIRLRRPGGKVVDNLNQRIWAWWGMILIIFLALFVGNMGTVALFGVVSFLALREFISLVPTRKADHRALFWAFFIITPLQYYFVAIQWYGMMSIFIPVYAFIFMAIRGVLGGDATDYLTRTSKIQWALMVCVFSLSHIPAFVMLSFQGGPPQNFKLILFLLTVVQISDILQYCFGKLFGKHPVAPNISPNKTVEGLVGGVLSASLIGVLLHPITPFNWWQAGLISLLLTALGFCGGLVMSAIKRDQGVKDFGVALPGHGGILDRVDSLCFSAPVFFHVVRYYFDMTPYK
jgi:phosphatidate cytidylyltransferase